MVDGFDAEALELTTNDDFIHVKTADGRYLKTGVSDYVTEFGVDDKPIAFVNNRNMLNIEEPFLRNPEWIEFQYSIYEYLWSRDKN